MVESYKQPKVKKQVHYIHYIFVKLQNKKN